MQSCLVCYASEVFVFLMGDNILLQVGHASLLIQYAFAMVMAGAVVVVVNVAVDHTATFSVGCED